MCWIALAVLPLLVPVSLPPHGAQPLSGGAQPLLGAFVVLQPDVVIRRLFPPTLFERIIQQIIERNKLSQQSSGGGSAGAGNVLSQEDVRLVVYQLTHLLIHSQLVPQASTHVTLAPYA